MSTVKRRVLANKNIGRTMTIRFKKVFKQDATPPVTGFAFQINTDDTDGGAEAFVRKIVFYSN